MPKVTVVIATFRNDPQIPKLIGESLRGQTMSGFFLVVVDERAKEPDVKQLYKYALKGIKYKLVPPREPRDGGYREAMFRNTGLSHARGELVIFLDDLGIYPDDIIEKHVRVYDESGGGVTAIGVCEFKDTKTDEITLDYRAREDSGHPGRLYEWFYCSNASLPRKLANELNGFDEEYDGAMGYADVDLGMRAHFSGHRFKLLKDCIITELRTGDRHAGVKVERSAETNRARFIKRQRELESAPRFVPAGGGIRPAKDVSKPVLVKKRKRKKKDKVRLAFVWMLPKNVLSWDKKRDAFHNTIKRLNALDGVECMAFLRNSDDLSGVRLMDGYSAAMAATDEMVIRDLYDFRPDFICMAMPGIKANDGIFDTFKGNTMLAVYEFGGDSNHFRQAAVKRQVEQVDVMFVQQEYRKHLVMDSSGNGRDMFVVPHGVDTERFHPLLPGEEKMYDVVMVADYREVIKRNHLLVHAAEHMPGKRILMIGRSQGHIPANYFTTLKNMIKDKRLEDRIDIVNDIDLDRVAYLVRHSKVGVLTSSTEGGSRSLMEYMACELPCVVCSDCVANTELITNGAEMCGVSVPPTGVNIADAVKSLLDNEKVLAKHGRYGRSNALENFSFDMMYARFRKALITLGLLPPINVAVLTTSFNRKEYITSCIKYVNIQEGSGEYFNIRHVIYDPGSTDGTVKYLKRKARGDDMLDLHIGEDEGQTDALVKGMEYILTKHPEVEYVGWINADDYYHQGWTTESVLALEGSSDRVAFSFTDCCVDYTHEEKDKITRTRLTDVIEVDLTTVKKRGFIEFQNTLMFKSKMLHKLLDTDGWVFNPEYHYVQDQELKWRLYERGHVSHHVRKFLSVLRSHPGQMSHTHFDEQQEELKRLVAERDQRRKLLLVISNTQIGGMEMLLRQRVSRLHRQYDITLLTTKDGAGALHEGFSTCCDIVSADTWKDVPDMLKKMLKSGEYGIVHVIGGISALDDVDIHDDVVAVAEFHIDLNNVKGQYWDDLANSAMMLMDRGVRVVTGGKQNEDILPGIHVMPSAVDTQLFYPAGKKNKVVWVGKPTAHKRPKEALEVAKCLIRNGYEFTVIIGQGSGGKWMTECRRLASSSESFKMVVGATQKEVARELSDARYFFAPYKHDCCSVAVLEAMSSGCIVVATDTGNLREMVNGHGKCIANDDNVTKSAIAAFGELSATNTSTMARDARRYVVKHYNLRDYVREHIRMYAGDRR
tara:strand:+ start:4358 stop:8026 length:3669 start_codon:yes stop_codon:yes gene_type:complete